jgi:hypothetical protein
MAVASALLRKFFGYMSNDSFCCMSGDYYVVAQRRWIDFHSMIW